VIVIELFFVSVTMLCRACCFCGTVLPCHLSVYIISTIGYETVEWGCSKFCLMHGIMGEIKLQDTMSELRVTLMQHLLRNFVKIKIFYTLCYDINCNWFSTWW